MNSKCRNLWCKIFLFILMFCFFCLFILIIKDIFNKDDVLTFGFTMILIVIIFIMVFLIFKYCQQIPQGSGGGGISDSKDQTENDHLDDFELIADEPLDLEDEDELPPINEPQIPTQTPEGKRVLIITMIASFVTALIFVQFGMSAFGSSSIEGRWVYEMEEYSIINGVENLTDYYYMEFYPNGTMKMGLKNVNQSAEVRVGVGTWRKSGTEFIVYIDYDSGGSLTARYKIRLNQLIDVQTNQGTHYYRD